MALATFLIDAAALGPLDCTKWNQQRSNLAKEALVLMNREVAGERLSRAERARLRAIEERRRQLLVCSGLAL